MAITIQEIQARKQLNPLTKYATSLNWDEVREGIQQGARNSQALAIAPNTSTALIQGCTASVLPVFSRFFMEKTGKGVMPMCPPFLKDKFWYYQENKNVDQQKLIDILSLIQNFTDTGISSEFLFDLNKESVNAKYIYDTLIHAWKMKLKTTYYIRSLDKQKSADEECTSCAG